MINALAEDPALGQTADGSGLSKRAKAAMILQMVLAEGKSLTLSRLPEDVQLALMRELGKLRLIDKDTLESVAAEFAQDLDRIGLTAPKGVEAALAALAGQISPAAAAKLRHEAGAARGLHDPWAQIVALDTAALLAIVETESTEVAAVILSKLDVAKAADLLGKLPGDRARRITLAVCQTGDIRPDAVARIGAALTQAHCSRPDPAFPNPADQRVGAILNSSPAATRDRVLDGLGAEDPAFADRVRKTIFTFADIPHRVQTLDIPKLVRMVDQGDLVTGLTYALAAGGDLSGTAEFILSSMSQRMADSLREEIAERGRIRQKEGESALGQIVATIRGAADSGEITLTMDEEEAD